MRAVLLSLLFAALLPAHADLQPNRLYRAASLAEEGPEPERSYCRLLMSVYERLAGEHRSDFVVLLRSTQEVNAYAALSGKGEKLLIFTPRLVNGLKDDEAALASIVGHEIGHHAKGHTTAGRDRSRAVDAAATIAGAIVDYTLAKRGSAVTGIGRDAGNAAGKLVILKFSRDQEREADAFGLVAMTRAGFDPEGAVRAQQKFLKAFGNRSVSLMASHPPSKERVENLRAQIKADPAMSAAAQKAQLERSLRGSN
jgi:predicted Zn-dependent protease